MPAQDLPHDYARCEGASSTLMGVRTLAHECTDCLRRTSSRTHSPIWWLLPPTKFPCMHRITELDTGDEQ